MPKNAFFLKESVEGRHWLRIVMNFLFLFAQGTKFSPQGVLDRYLETIARESPNRPRSAPDEEIKLLREQLVLLHIELQFERQRRDVHAERNRRLLGKSRQNRALEEHRNALVSSILRELPLSENMLTGLQEIR